MRSDELSRRARTFKELHRPGRPLVLPTLWDAASAQAAFRAGCSAIGTSSGALAGALGWEDHENIPLDLLVRVLDQIAGSVACPVSADMEAGFDLSPSALVRTLLDAGVVGCNLEDSDPRTFRLRTPRKQAAWLAAVRKETQAEGIPLVINARIDVWLHGDGDRRERLKESLLRTHRYADAGVDCVYPIGLRDPQLIEEFVQGARLPVNVICAPDPVELSHLRDLGVARVSFGKSIFKTIYGDLEGRLTQFFSSPEPK